MSARSSVDAHDSRPIPRNVRRSALDDLDRQILHLLQQDARIPNNTLAAAVGIAPSTCLARVRALRAAGIIRGFHAEVDLAAMGRGLQAMVAVRMQAGARHQLAAFARRLAARPEVMDLYFLAGADDFLVHVAVEDSDALRIFVLDQLSARPEVALTETSLIFEHLRSNAARRA
jgi:DNA-binding Lrp family transcriptional regulator